MSITNTNGQNLYIEISLNLEYSKILIPFVFNISKQIMRNIVFQR